MIKYLTLLIVKFCWIYIYLIHIRQIQSMNEYISEDHNKRDWPTQKNWQIPIK